MPISIVPQNIKISNAKLNVSDTELESGIDDLKKLAKIINKQLEIITDLEIEEGDI